MCCQSIAQLEARYGKADAQAILGGFNSYLTYSGSDPETASFFEEDYWPRSGKDSPVKFLDHIDEYRDYYLMHANEIRTMEKDQVLIVSSNKKPRLAECDPLVQEQAFYEDDQKGQRCPACDAGRMTRWNLSGCEGGGVQDNPLGLLYERRRAGWVADLCAFGRIWVAAFFTRISGLLERSNILIFVIFAPALVVGLVCLDRSVGASE